MSARHPFARTPSDQLSELVRLARAEFERKGLTVPDVRPSKRGGVHLCCDAANIRATINATCERLDVVIRSPALKNPNRAPHFNIKMVGWPIAKKARLVVDMFCPYI